MISIPSHLDEVPRTLNLLSATVGDCRTEPQVPVTANRLSHSAQYRADLDECEGRSDWFACMGEVIARRLHGH